MNVPLRARVARFVAAVALATSSLALATTAHAADPLVLRVGTDQDLQVLNPWFSVVVADYEVFTLNYDLLVGFDINLQPAPGFADRWESSSDGKTHTFHIREGMTWSDGEPATAADAEYTYQLVLDAVASEAGYIGSGYLEPYLTNAGLKTVKATDEHTLVVTTEFPTTLLTQAYVPILPKHIWSKYKLNQIGDTKAKGFFKNEPPVVGTGPYQAVEWEAGDFIRFKRNESYWGQKGAADEVIIQHFSSMDTMAQALKNGDVDYIRGVQPNQFDALGTDPDIKPVEGFANGYDELAFNTRGKTQGARGSTNALTDPKFRDALGYAIDQQKLVESTLAGHGVAGTTIVPPYHTAFHVEPTTPRHFDLEEAKRRLDAAGYKLDGQGRRLDKDGQPISLRLTWPDSEGEHATDAQFIAGWFKEVGVDVQASVTEEGKLIDDLIPKEGDGPANFDMFIWGWVGDPDPHSLLYDLTTDSIGSLSDSFFSNERYDELFKLQQRATDPEQRKTYMAEMQNIVYDQAPYIVLYYDSELHAYRTDRFANWTNQPPDSGTPLFGYGPVGYTLLQVAGASPSPAESNAAPNGGSGSPAGSGSGTPAPTSGGGDNTTLFVVLAVVIIAAIGGGILVLRRRQAGVEEE